MREMLTCEDYLDQVELAHFLKVSKMAVSKAIKSGRLKKSVSKTPSGRYQIHLREAWDEWRLNADLSKDHGNHVKAPERNPLEGTFETQDSRRIREHYLALQEKTNYEKEIGTLLDKEQMDKEVFDAFRIVRDKLLNLPDSESTYLAAEQDSTKIRTHLIDALEKTLEDIANTVD